MFLIVVSTASSIEPRPFPVNKARSSNRTNPAICNSLPGFAGRLLGAGETKLYQRVRWGCRKLHLEFELGKKIGSVRAG
jgi:hypothetical protein